ncbi:MAG: T9SS type A sorting domain-containing protein [Bacteroidia bacterium]|nr:T9SS type A sorting domain-containing protein [Bacteroidia bacterium]
MQKRLLLLLILCCFFTINKVEASHTIGAEIEYESIGPRVWKIKLTVYGDCNTFTLCNGMNCQLTVRVSPNNSLNSVGCSALPNTINVNLSLVKLEDLNKSVTDLCGNIAKNGCTNLGQVTGGPLNPSIEKYVFEGTLDMSIPSLNNTNCSYWDISWDYCCRQEGVWNIITSNELLYSVRATINIFNRTSSPVRNNSPKLKNEPILVTCSGQEQILNAGATDPDGDSLTYELGPPFASSSANQIVNYRYPGSPVYPFPLIANKAPHINYPQPNGPYVVIDNTNGDISFNAANNTSSIIYGNLNTFIKQWSYDTLGNPVLVGITMRDFQYYTLNCPNNNPPQLRTIPSLPYNKPQYNYEVEAGQQLCFTVTAKDTDAYPTISRFDTTFISWNEGLVRPGKLSFAPTYAVGAGLPRPREDQWQFCWQTETTDIRTLPYYFTITAVDKFCPTIGQVTKAFSVQVIPPTPIASFTQLTSNLNCARYRYRVYKNSPYTWLHQASLKIATKPNDKTFANNVINVAHLSINPQAGMFDSIGEPRLMFIDSFQFNQPGTYYLLFSCNTTSNPNKALQVLDSIVVSADSILTSIIFTNNNPSFCAGDSALLSVNFINPSYIYQWQVNEHNILQATTTSFNAKQQGLYRVIVTDTALNCNTFSNTIRVDAHPRVIPKPSILVHYNCAFSLNNISYFDSSKVSSGTFTRLWSFGDSTTSTEQSGTKMYTTAKTYSVKLTLTSNFGCIDSAATIIPIIEPINLVISSNKSANICQGESVLLSCINYPNANYYWFKNNELLSNANSNILTVNQQGNYKLVIAMGPDCKDTSNTITVQVNPIPNVGFTINNTSQCLNTNRFILIDTTTIASGNYTRVWTWANNTSSLQNLNLSFTDTGLYYLQLKVTSIHGCSDSSSKKLTVLANSTIDSINGSINNLSNHQTYNYFVNQRPNNTYYWLAINGNIISGQGTNSVAVNYLQPGTGQLKAIATNTNGCSDTASITVNILSNPPYILNFNPKKGSNGTVVTINGGNFYGTSAVTFGGTNAQKFTEVSPNVILAIVDSGATGDVVVVTSSGTDSLSLFTYVARSIITEIGSQWFSIFPNPASVEVSIESNLSLQYVTFELFDLNGKIVISKTCNNPISKYTIDVKELNPAIYLLRITSNGH